MQGQAIKQRTPHSLVQNPYRHDRERIITAAVVTSGEKGDGPELPALLEASQENGIEVNTIIATQPTRERKTLSWPVAGYKIVAKLSPSITQGFRKEENTFDYNKDAGMLSAGRTYGYQKSPAGKKDEAPTKQILISSMSKM